LNLRPLGYEHPNRRLSPLPWSPPSLHVLGHAGRGVSAVATRPETCRHVLVTGLVTGSDGPALRPAPPPTVILVHASGYTSRWSPFANRAKSAVSLRSREHPSDSTITQLVRSTALTERLANVRLRLNPHPSWSKRLTHRNSRRLPRRQLLQVSRLVASQSSLPASHSSARRRSTTTYEGTIPGGGALPASEASRTAQWRQYARSSSAPISSASRSRARLLNPAAGSPVFRFGSLAIKSSSHRRPKSSSSTIPSA
jgi:hypothetical protein